MGKKAKQSFLTLEGFESSPYKLKQKNDYSLELPSFGYKLQDLGTERKIEWGVPTHVNAKFQSNLVRITWFEDYGAIKLMKKTFRTGGPISYSQIQA